LYVSYISEVPIWKTTYRIVLPSKADKKPLLQGWAIVDNTVGEDWDGVQLSNLLETLLFGVTAVAPGIYVGTAGMLLLVALMACVIPAQRASRVDPAVALRND